MQVQSSSVHSTVCEEADYLVEEQEPDYLVVEESGLVRVLVVDRRLMPPGPLLWEAAELELEWPGRHAGGHVARTRGAAGRRQDRQTRGAAGRGAPRRCRR